MLFPDRVFIKFSNKLLNNKELPRSTFDFYWLPTTGTRIIAATVIFYNGNEFLIEFSPFFLKKKILFV